MITVTIEISLTLDLTPFGVASAALCGTRQAAGSG